MKENPCKKRRVKTSVREAEKGNKWAPAQEKLRLYYRFCLTVFCSLLYLSKHFSLITQLFSPTLFLFNRIFFYPQHLLVSLPRLHSPSSLSLPALSTEARASWAENASPSLSFAVPDSLSRKSHPLFTFLALCIGCLRSGLRCSSPCTDGRERITKTYSLYLSIGWLGKMLMIRPLL